MRKCKDCIHFEACHMWYESKHHGTTLESFGEREAVFGEDESLCELFDLRLTFKVLYSTTRVTANK